MHELKGLLVHVVTLVKGDGTRIDDIKATVSKESIITFDDSLPIEEGDTIEHVRPNGFVERYTVLDVHYGKGMKGMPSVLSMEVRKETAIPRTPPSPPNVYNLHGANARVNNQSLDASVNIARIEPAPVFDELREAIRQITRDEDRVPLLARVDEMQETQGTPGFLAKYQAFMQQAANHATVIAPFIGPLAQLLS